MESIELRPRPSNRRLLPAWYAEILAVQTERGLSTAALARATGIAESSLHRWRRRIDADRDARHEVVIDEPAVVEVVVAPTASRDRTTMAPLTVHLPKLRSIEVPGDFDLSTLTKLVEALESC